MNRLIFTVGIVTAMSPTALMLLRVSQFPKMKLGDDMVWKIRSSNGSLDRTSKTNLDGWKLIADKPQEIFVWD